MQLIKKLILTVVATLGLGGMAKADLIDLGLRNLTGVLGSPSSEAAFIQADQGLLQNLVHLQKFEYGSGWTGGALSSGYFDVDPNSGETAIANVSWDLTGTGYEVRYVLVKNGRTGAFHLDHLYGVTADQYVVGGGDVTINGQKGISHISFFGLGGVTSVPEGGATVAMLGIALAGISLGRRFFWRAEPNELA